LGVIRLLNFLQLVEDKSVLVTAGQRQQVLSVLFDQEISKGAYLGVSVGGSDPTYSFPSNFGR